MTVFYFSFHLVIHRDNPDPRCYEQHTSVRSLTAHTKAGQSTYHPLHRPLTKQTNQTRIHTLVIFCHPFSGPDRQSGPELNEHKVRREEKKERERERDMFVRKERGFVM